MVSLFAQGLQEWPERHLSTAEVEQHIRFLSADELGGRQPGHPGHAIAARYIATSFQAMGVQPLPGLQDYYQPIPMGRMVPPRAGHIRWGKQEWAQGGDLLSMSGEGIEGEFPAVFVGYGWIGDSTDDYAGLDLMGKVAIALQGLPEPMSPGKIIAAGRKKAAWAAERGALALIELYTLPYPWKRLMLNFTSPAPRVLPETEDTRLFHAWLNDPEEYLLRAFKEDTSVTLAVATETVRQNRFTAPNVVGVIPGRDSSLREEYVLLSAHYDHVGTGGDGPDTIYNGARDNAIGIAGLLAAARSLSEAPPRRSIILLACTAEEMGMLGSQWFVDHSPLPLSQLVYNLNYDGAGYNDRTAFTVLGYERTGIRPLIDRTAQWAHLNIIADPMPEQNLFDRSDNVSFAAAGLPCLSFSPGITEMDETILAHYHQPSDEADGLHFDYLRQLSSAFVHLARLIADQAARPFWQPDDPYYEAGRALYAD